MLSDTCFEMIEELLDAITRYDYSDEYMLTLIQIIMSLNEIRDDLDSTGEGNRLKNNEEESLKIVLKMIKKARQKR